MGVKVTTRVQDWAGVRVGVVSVQGFAPPVATVNKPDVVLVELTSRFAVPPFLMVTVRAVDGLFTRT